MKKNKRGSKAIIAEHAFKNLEQSMKKEKYKLGDKTFKTKTEVTEHYKGILQSYELQSVLNRDDSIDVYYLLLNHPGVDIKMAKPISSIYVDTAQYQTRCFYLNYNDGTKDDFSYTQCVKNLKQL